MTAYPTPRVTPPNWGQQLLDAVDERIATSMAGVELGYAERTTTFTTTNTTYGSIAAGSKIGSLSISLTGAGKAVNMFGFFPNCWHSVANTPVSAYIIVNGAMAGGTLGGTISQSTTTGHSIWFHRRLVLTNAVAYTIEVGVYGGAAGTTTFGAAGGPTVYGPLSLQIVSAAA